MANLLYLNQFITTSLSVVGGIDASQTTGIVVQSTSGLDTTKPGVACLSYTDPLDLDNAEYIEYSAINSTTKEFTGVTRGAEGYSAKTHSNGVTIAFPVSESHVNRLADALSIGGDATNGVTGVIDDDTMATASDTTLATSESVKGYVDGNRNIIINSGFTVNQRGYVSNATLAAGAYGHDRWKAGASGGDYTFTQLKAPTQITIKAGKSLIQVVEDINVEGGTYTLSWEGTAQARAGVDSATPSGAYAASPLTISSQTAGTVMSVEFNEGTLGKVVLTKGSVAGNYFYRTYEEELRACQRYCYVPDTSDNLSHIGVGIIRTSTLANPYVQFPVEMRTAPSLTVTPTDWQVFHANLRTDCTNLILASSSTSKTGAGLSAVVASGLTAGGACILITDGTANRLAIFDAEL